MDCAAVRLVCHAPAMRGSHRHQQGVTRFKAHAPTTDFGDEFATQDVNPLVLFVMQVKRRAAICVVLPDGKYIDGKPPGGVGGTNHFG